jgi:hypothetical protein
MTNKELVLSVYPKAKLAKTSFGYSGFRKNLIQKYYIRNGDSVISNQLIEGSPQQVWKYAATKIKKAMVERLER